jgi:hypothetical protein
MSPDTTPLILEGTQRSAVFVGTSGDADYLAAAPDGRRFFVVTPKPPALRHYPGLRLRKEPPGAVAPAPVAKGYYWLVFTPKGEIAVTNRVPAKSLACFQTLAEAWEEAARYRDALPRMRAAATGEPPERNTTRERARRARQAAHLATPGRQKRLEWRRAWARVMPLGEHYRREYEGRATWRRITLRQRCAKVAEYRETLKRIATLREFNRLIGELNAGGAR